MKWVLIDSHHVNMDRVTFFAWHEGRLILFSTDDNSVYVDDPNKDHYRKLCRQMGLTPYEEDAIG